MFRLNIVCGLFLFVVPLASTCAASHIYTINQVDLGDGYQISEGFIEIDIQSGNLALENLVDWEIVVTGPVPYTFSRTNPGRAIYLSGTVLVTPQEILLPTEGGSIFGNSLYFEAFDSYPTEGATQGVGFDVRNSKFKTSRVEYYIFDSDNDYANATVDYTPVVPLQIATTVPEPSTIILLLLGAVPVFRYGKRRRHSLRCAS